MLAHIIVKGITHLNNEERVQLASKLTEAFLKRFGEQMPLAIIGNQYQLIYIMQMV